MKKVCSYCGNELEDNETKTICPECGRVANTQQVVNTEDLDVSEMMPIFGIDD